ncbi:MAG: GDP-mannose 4,6-dehydratase [Acidobacteriia bacterium]|nr:GDP-mannose 4,6-dehydratase [Terriglobia bacterium]
MVDSLLADDPANYVAGMSRSPEKDDLFLPYKSRRLDRFEFHRVDINRDTQRMFSLLDRLEPAYVINFAAQGEVATSWLFPEQWYETNAVGTVKLCHFLKDRTYLNRYVHISTPEVYGSCRNATESAPLDPSTPYAASKAAADLFLFTLVKQYGFPLVMIRSTNVYGKHQQLYRIIPRTIISLLSGRKIRLHGGGKAVKSYIHIRDVCHGILAATRRGGAGALYHFSPETSISIRDLVEKICVLMGYDFDQTTETIEERPGQDARYIIDSSKARRELDWAPTIPLPEGLNEVICWVTESFDRIREEPLEYVHMA